MTKRRRDALTGSTPLMRLMQRFGIPVARQSYINLAYWGTPPKDWTPEHEEELPRKLRK
jgi:hypothetical protein